MQTTMMTPQGSAVADLERALEVFPYIFGVRVANSEIETLCFCLRHLFNSTDTLCRVTLADMALYEYSPDPDPATGHVLWLQLQEVTHILERIEALCHLLNGGVVATMAALERTSSIHHPDNATLVAKEHVDILNELALDRQMSQTQQYATHTQSASPGNTLASYLQSWQQYRRFSFVQQLAYQVPLTFPLARLDQALFVLLANLQAIFTQVLPAFHTLAVYDDEKIAMLLLDLVQKSDLLLLQVNIMLEPCHLLLKRYVSVLKI